jgi:hypothetical protein
MVAPPDRSARRSIALRTDDLRMSKKPKRRGFNERYVGLRYWLLTSPAWRSLPGNARALYVELAMQYNGINNGRIPYSVRQAANALHISGQTAMRTLRLLQDRGFIVCTKKGAFSMKAVRDASEWRLTEYSDDVRPNHATKEFMRWRPPEADVDAAPKSRTRLSWWKRTLPPEEPYGCCGGSVSPKKAPDGCPSGSVSGQNRLSALPPEQHIQLPGTACAALGGERSAPEGSAVASEPPDWRPLGYPPGTPSSEEIRAALERRAQERARARLPRRRAGGRGG